MPSTQLTAPLSSAGLVNPSLALLGGLIGAMVHRPTCDLVPTNCLLRLACSKATRWGPCFFAVGLQPLAAEIRGLPGLDVSLFYLDDGLLAVEITAVAAALALIQQRQLPLTSSSTWPKVKPLLWVTLTFLSLRAPCHLTSFVMPLVTAASRATSNSLVLHWAVMLFWHHTLPGGPPPLPHCWMPLPRWRTLKSLCACCAIVLALAALCTACAVCRRCPSNPPWKLLIKRFGGASLQSGLPLGAESLEQAERGLSCKAWIPPTLSVTWILHHRLTSSPLRAALHLYRSTSDTSGHDICLEASAAFPEVGHCASWNSQFDPAVPATKPLLLSEAEPGARAFLAALPHGRTRMEGPFFLAELRRRLGVPDAAQDAWCPRCDGILDTHSHHAGMCLAGGDRTRRHHAARGLLPGPSVLASPLKLKRLSCCCCPNDQKMHGLPSGGLLMFTSQLWRAPRLRLTWPSPAPCGLRPLLKQVGMRYLLPVPTRNSRPPT